MTNKKAKNKGFTLMEIVIAVGLFTVIATFALGAILGLYDANRRSESSKTVADNLNMALENMVRTVRFGTNYHCGSGGSLSSPQNCSGGDTFFAVNFEGSTVIYRLSGNAIQKSENGGGSYTNVTSSDTVVQYLRFYVFGSSLSDSVQPYIVAVIKGYVGNKPTTQSVFSIQTLMSQRTLDI